MRVNVSRRAQVGMPEQFLYEFQIACLLIDYCCGGVPEGVEAGSPAVPARSSGLLLAMM